MRISENPIQTRGYVFEPDYIIILDDTLDLNDCLKGAKKDTVVIINTSACSKYHAVDATSIAFKQTGKNIPNIITLGALFKFIKEINFSQFKKAVETELNEYSKDIIQKNIKGAEQALAEVK